MFARIAAVIVRLMVRHLIGLPGQRQANSRAMTRWQRET